MKLIDSILTTVLPMERLINYRNAKLSKGKLDFAFKDNYGRKWYYFRDREDMPLSRLAEQQTHLQYLASGLSGDMFKDACNQMKECLSEGDSVSAGVILHDLQEIPKKITNIEAMVNVIAVNYVRDDEDAMTVTQSVHDQKCDFIIDQLETGGFFLSHPSLKVLLKTFGITGQHLSDSLPEFLKVLRKFRTRLDLIRSEMSKRKLQKTDSPSQDS